MARLGLGDRWKTLLANDFDPQKANAYARNFKPRGELIVGDVNHLSAADLPKGGLMAWASFPCQDLSLAGHGKGLYASRSGSYWPFWRVMKDMIDIDEPIPIITLENVVGLLHSNSGKDFTVLLKSLQELGYAYGAMVVDAVHFVPQSRPRLFIVAAMPEIVAHSGVAGDSPCLPWHPTRMARAVNALDSDLRESWVWWKMPKPSIRNMQLNDLILSSPGAIKWHGKAETDRLLSMMSPLHRKKIEDASRGGATVVGTIYRRTRPDKDGRKVQRAEVRFDGIAGCLRTPAGGSSRQTIIVIQGRKIRTRLLDPREAARLMGVPEWYELPERYNDAYHLMGDGLAVPAVSWIEQHVLRPLARSAESQLAHQSAAVA